MTTDVEFMRHAIAKAREGLRMGQAPFGACLVQNGVVIGCAYNQVWHNTDITAHAEIQVIRAGCRKLQSVHLIGCTIYSTCEPCPMCFSAIHWALIDKIVFGARIGDASGAAFHELTITNEEMKRFGGSNVQIVGDVCAEDARALFAEWQALPNHRAY